MISSGSLIPSTMGPCICSSLRQMPVNRSARLGTHSTVRPMMMGSQASSSVLKMGLPLWMSGAVIWKTLEPVYFMVTNRCAFTGHGSHRSWVACKFNPTVIEEKALIARLIQKSDSAAQYLVHPLALLSRLRNRQRNGMSRHVLVTHPNPETRHLF